MANLLSWSNSISIKKKDENTPLITSLRTMNPVSVRASAVNTGASNNAASGALGALNRVQQANDQMRQQAEQQAAEQRRQQEEKARQQRLEQMRQQQEQQRQQQEQRRQQEQQQRQQQQNRLLSSSLGGGALSNNLTSGNQSAFLSNAKKTVQQPVVQQQDAAEKQRQLNEAKTKRLTSNYERRINQNTNLLNRLRSGETNMNAGSTNFLGQQAFKQNNFGQAEAPLALKNNLAERTVENEIRGDRDILRKVKNGSRPITLAQGMGLVGDEISQAAGNAILGEATEDESFGKQLLRGLINLPGSIVGEPMRFTGQLQYATDPNATKNVIEKNADGTASINVKENNALNRLGAAVDAAMIPVSMAGGGITPAIAKTVAKGLTKTTLKNAAKQAVKTGVEEASQEATQNLAQELSENGQWDEGTLGRTAQAAALGGILGGAVSGATSAAGAIKSGIQSRQNANETNVAQNTGGDVAEAASPVGNTQPSADETSITPGQVQYTQNGTAIKANPDGTMSQLSDAELASVVQQGRGSQSVADTVNGVNPFRTNSVNFGPSDSDINALSRRAAQGDTYAQQRLAELTQQNQNEDADWRGQSVDEVINPEQQAENTSLTTDLLTGERYVDEGIDGESLTNSPTLNYVDENAVSPNQASLLSQINVVPEEQVPNVPQILPSERAIAQPQTPAQNVAGVPNADMQTDPITGERYVDTGIDGEGVVEASTSVPTTEELSVQTPEQQRENWVRQPSKNSTEVASVDEVLTNDGGNKRKFTTILRGVSNRVADVVKNAIGLDVRSYDHTIDNYAAQHAMYRHGNDKIPLKASDFNLAQDIIKNPDTVEYSTKDGGAIIYTKQYDNRVVYLEEARNKRHELAMKTMYWQEAPKNSTTSSANPRPELDTDSLRALSRQREGASDSNIPQTPENVNLITDPITGEQYADEGVDGEGRIYENEAEGLPENFDVAHYVTEQVEAQNKRSKLPIKEKIGDVTAELKHYLVDDAVAYERYIKDKNERLNIREGVDRVRASDMIARQFMLDHGLEDAVNMPEKAKNGNKGMDEFQQYLIAKRALELSEQGKTTGRSKAADEALIKAVGHKYDAEEAIVRQYTRDMLEYSAENGLISQRFKNDLLKNNPNYVPMNRVFDVVEQKSNHKSKQLANLSKQSVVQKLKGSERTVANPIESLMENTLRMVNEAERNKTAKMIAQTTAFHEKTLAEGEKPRAGYDTLNYLVNGEKVTYEVPELVAREMKNLNSVLPGWVETTLQIAGAPTKWLRAGATQNNPIFSLSNLARDQLETLVTGQGAGPGKFKSNLAANIKGTPQALIAAFSPGKKGRELRAELNRAGIVGTEYRQTYGYKPGELVKQLQADAKLTKNAAERLKHPINALADLIGRTEYFTRAQQYYGTDGDATVKAQAARGNTLNFGRAGTATRVLNRVIPFLNAGVQGGRKLAQSFSQRPVHTSLSIIALTGVAAAAAAAFKAQNKELWDRINESDKGQNIIIDAGNAHYDPDTNRVEGVIKIPMPQLTYPLLGILNNDKSDAAALASLAGDVFTAFTGIEAPNSEQGVMPVVNQLTPTIVRPFLETAMNKDTYTGNELVSEYDANRNPEDKGAKYSTQLARTVAKATGIDAPIVDNFISEYGGTLTRDLVKYLGDNPDNKSDGGGVGEMLGSGLNRRFGSATITSQYEIMDKIAEGWKNDLRENDAFKSLSSNDQVKVLNAIDNDKTGIAGIAAKTEQGRDSEIGDSKLTKRQTELVNNGFDANSYIKSVMDKKSSYSGSGSKTGSEVSTLGGNVSSYGNTSSRNNAIEISDGLRNKYADLAGVLDKYNSMSSEDWEEYINGSSAESAAAESKLASAKFNNDVESGKLEEGSPAYIKRLAEVNKLAASQNYEKKYRDAYALAGNKSDIQTYLNGLDDETRAQTVAILNGLNNEMLRTGMIAASTYKTRGNAINNLTSSKSSGGRKSSGSKSSSGMSSAEASALSSLAKTMASSTSTSKASTPKAPTTKRKMTKTRSSSNTKLATYTPSTKKTTVTKGTKKNIS